MSQEATYSVTFVMGKPPMVTVRGDSADEWKTNLDAADKSGALTKIRAINDSLNGVNPAAVPGPAIQVPSPDGRGTVTIQDGQVVSPPRQELPSGFANPPCVECGGATRLHPTKPEGNSPQSGKPYRRFVCATSQDHKNTFINA